MTTQILEEYFGSPERPEGVLSLIELDGYLTSIVIGPEPLMPSEWIPGLWGGAGKSGFKNPEQAQAVLGAVMARYNEIIRQLDSAEEFRPLYMPHDPNERLSELAGEWAQGFWNGVLLRGGDWWELIRDRKGRVMLAPILCFILDEDGEHVLPMEPEELDDLMIDAGIFIPHVVRVIRDFWRTRPQKSTPAERVGRNDPCPCGSGRKYKRCCGAN